MVVRFILAAFVVAMLCARLAGADSPGGPEKKNALQQPCNIDPICAAVHNETRPIKKCTKAFYPVVDLFYMYSDSNRLAYVRDGHYWTMPSVAMKFSEFHPITNKSDIRIHICADSDRMLTQARSYGYYAYDLREYVRKYEHFRWLVHNTVTSTEYEVTIFRWKVYNSIVSDWNSAHGPHDRINRILTVDGDVLLTMSPAKFYQDVVDTFRLNATAAASPAQTHSSHHTHHEDSHELINIAYGVVALFSPRGLAAFDAYIDSWYTGAADDEIIAKCKQTGLRYWSDMMLLERFLGTNTTVRNNCFEYDRYKKYYQGWRMDSDNQCLLKALQCLPMSNYYDQGIRYGMHFYVDNKRVTLTNSTHANTATKKNLSIKGPLEDYPYCFMVSSALIVLHCNCL